MLNVEFEGNMKQITYRELQQWKAEGKAFQLVDVREANEHQNFNIGGELIPLSHVVKAKDRLDLSKPIVLYCKRGIRSQIAIQRLSQKFPQADLYNLQNGILFLKQT